ncbi:hypothetical protein MTP99_005733 [Tenebrio molitor]|nr:hypothetical protein MTP99_005733 [Tenebrio molitor]
MTSHAIPFAIIAAFFRDNNQQLQRGEIGYRDGHVLKMTYDGTVQPALVKGVVQASMKKKSYEVEISIDSDDGITQAKCTCPRGAVICHHMASLCIYAHYNISSTDEACQWNAPKPSTVAEVQTLKDLHPSKRQNYKAVDRNVSDNEINTFLAQLEGTTVGFSWLLKPEPADRSFQMVPIVEDILSSEDYLVSVDKNTYLLQQLALSQETIIDVASLTTGQATNENWLVVRKNRLTASKFGLVLAAYKRQRFPPSLYKSLMEGYDLDGIRAVQWGKENEETAINLFTAATNLEVQRTGLWLHECGFLGASPDGLLEDAVIEVKCPYKYRNVSMREKLRTDKSYIIYKDPTTDQTHVNEKHAYWHQIQRQMHITGRSKCYLVIWTPQECEIVQVPKVDTWAENIQLLQDFYLNKFIHFISLGHK